MFGDILKLNGIQVLVNAANERMQHGGGIAGIIANAAGPELRQYCDKTIVLQGPIQNG